jgi:hypothetical protein
LYDAYNFRLAVPKTVNMSRGLEPTKIAAHFDVSSYLAGLFNGVTHAAKQGALYF